MAEFNKLLEEEAGAWHDLAPEAYDRAVCGMIESQAGDAEAVIELIRAALRHSNVTLTESRACAAEHLIRLGLVESRASLFLIAWLQLAAVVECGPDSISLVPEMPFGTQLPYGADPAAITDPDLRQRALKLALAHKEEIEHWNAKQRALGHLSRLAALMRQARTMFADTASWRDLIQAMSLAPMPGKLQSVLETEACPD